MVEKKHSFSIAQEFASIAGNRTLGASQLYRKVCLSLQVWSKMGADEELEDLVDRVASLQPEMASFRYLSNQLQTLSTREEVGWKMEELLYNAEVAPQQLARHLLPILPIDRPLMTISHSSTVARILEEGENRLHSVIVAESRPHNEGLSLARSLAKKGLSTIVCTDAAQLQLLATCGAVVIGADALSPTRLRNKVGTLALLLGARYFRIPSYVVCEKHKQIDESFLDQHCHNHDPTEVLSDLQEGLQVVNPYFEIAPRELLTEVFIA